jgi:hypothetical protein
MDAAPENGKSALQNDELSELTTGSQLTTPNLTIKIGEDTFVYRRFGNTKSDTLPLLCFSISAATAPRGISGRLLSPSCAQRSGHCANRKSIETRGTQGHRLYCELLNQVTTSRVPE